MTIGKKYAVELVLYNSLEPLIFVFNNCQGSCSNHEFVIAVIVITEFDCINVTMTSFMDDSLVNGGFVYKY